MEMASMNTVETKRRALRLHRACVLVDGHNDHLILKYARGEPYAFMKVHRRYHSDGVRLLRGGMTASFFMVGGHHLDQSLAMIERAHREVEAHPESLLLVRKASDIRTAKRTRRLGMMLTWESGLAYQNSVDVLHAAHRLGVRASTVTHNEGGTPFALQGSRSPFRYLTPRQRAAARRRAKGLTEAGRELVSEMQRIGMLVDLAHANDATIEDILELSTKPVVTTHGGAYACCPHSRCSTDGQIRAIAATGGLVSIAFYGGFIAQPPGSWPQRSIGFELSRPLKALSPVGVSGAKRMVDRIVDHIAHVADLAGIDHVGIGSDFDGLGEGVWPVIRTADRLPKLTEALVRRGFSDAEIRKVWGGNYLRVLEATVG
jgi:membrane dipeptidase